MSASVTPFLRLLKPPFDSVPWDEAINGNMDTIDAFIARYMAVPNYVGAWANSVQYISGQNVLDITDATIYQCRVTHTSSAVPVTFADDRATYPTYWAATTNVITGGTGNTNLTISSVTPLSAKAGDLWWDSVGGQLYILYNDGNSLQWVIANNQAGNVGEAPNDGNTYGRRNSGWTQVSTGNVGRNLIHNPLFNIAQRGVGLFTASGYTLDRWLIGFGTGDTVSIAQASATDTNRAQIGDEAAKFLLNCAFTGASGANNFVGMQHRVENLYRLANKTVTVSFYANAAAANAKVGVSIDQVFGSGGSPSASVLNNGQSVTLSGTAGTFARYALTFTIGSIAGKTVGTNGDDYTLLSLWLSSGSANATRSGNVGVQSGTINFWGVQLEIGNTATPLEKPDPRYDLSNCQRFYQLIGSGGSGITLPSYSSAAGTVSGPPIYFPPMRAAPTASVFVGGYAGMATAATVTGASLQTASPAITHSAAGYGQTALSLALSADL